MIDKLIIPDKHIIIQNVRYDAGYLQKHGTMTENQYRFTIENFLQPSAYDCPNILFQQDGTTVHTPKVTSKFSGRVLDNK